MASLSRLAQMVNRVRKQSGLTDVELATKKGVAPQTVANWSAGKIPRTSNIPKLAAFLEISIGMADELVEEAKHSAGNTKIPKMRTDHAPVSGAGSSDALIFVGRPAEFASPTLTGTYALRVNAKLMWVDPDREPLDGNTVVLRTGNSGRLATWPVDEEIAGVVVLAEMV